MFLFLSNKIHFLCNIQTSLIRSVEVNSEHKFDKDLKHNEHERFIIDNIDEFCSKVNPNKFTSKWSTKKVFENWQELIDNHHYESNNVVFEILVFKDILNYEIIKFLGYIEDLYMFHLNHDVFNVIGQKDISFNALFIKELYFISQDLYKNFRDNYGVYGRFYHSSSVVKDRFYQL